MSHFHTPAAIVDAGSAWAVQQQQWEGWELSAVVEDVKMRCTLPPALPTGTATKWPEHSHHCQMTQTPNGPELSTVATMVAAGV